MKRLMTIAFIGDRTTGKTKLVERVTGIPYDDEYEPTQGNSITLKKRNNVDVTWMDSSAEMEKATYLKQAAIIVLLVDLSHAISLEYINDYIKKIKLVAATHTQIVLVGTKKDLAQIETIDQFEALAVEGVEKKYSLSAKTAAESEIDNFTSSITHLGTKTIARNALDSLKKIKQYIETNEFEVGSYFFFKGGVTIQVEGHTKRVPHRVAEIYKRIKEDEQIRNRPGANPSRAHSRILKTLDMVQDIAAKAIDNPRPGRKAPTTEFYNFILNNQFDFDTIITAEQLPPSTPEPA